MGKVIKIKEGEFVKFMNGLLSEATPEGNTNSRIAQQTMGFNEKIDASLFRNGMDSIDTSNQQYLSVVNKLKTLPKDYSVTIVGSSSPVGSEQGYDNDKLSSRRIANFITALRSNGIDTTSYKTQVRVGKPNGRNTIKNSPEANAEQYINVIASKSGINVSAIDNTAVEKPQDKINPIQRTNGDEYATIKVPKKRLSQILDLLRKNGYKI